MYRVSTTNRVVVHTSLPDLEDTDPIASCFQLIGPGLYLFSLTDRHDVFRGVQSSQSEPWEQ